MKSERFIVVGDSHGDMQDDPSIAAVLQFCKDFKPTIRVHLGDAWDFRNLRKGASAEEMYESMADDWDMGEDFLRRFFEGGKRNHFLRGNHDERMYEAANNMDGLKRDYAHDGVKRMEGIMRKCRAKMLPYDPDFGVLELGQLNVLHGYYHGDSACVKHARSYQNCIFGHVHSIEGAPIPSRKPAEARSIGCLCIRDMPYVKRKVNKLRWANGWVYGMIFPGGYYQLHQARKINGRFCVATEFEEIAA